MQRKTKTESAVSTRMPRKSVSLPAEVQAQLEQIADRKKVSFAWVVRDAVDRYLQAETPLFRQ